MSSRRIDASLLFSSGHQHDLPSGPRAREDGDAGRDVRRRRNDDDEGDDYPTSRADDDNQWRRG